MSNPGLTSKTQMLRVNLNLSPTSVVHVRSEQGGLFDIAAQIAVIYPILSFMISWYVVFLNLLYLLYF